MKISFVVASLLLFFFTNPIFAFQHALGQAPSAQKAREEAESALRSAQPQRNPPYVPDRAGAKNSNENQRIPNAEDVRYLGSDEDDSAQIPQEEGFEPQISGGYITVGSGTESQSNGSGSQEVQAIQEPRQKRINWRGNDDTQVYQGSSQSPLHGGN